jgi:hypothetical protein
MNSFFTVPVIIIPKWISVIIIYDEVTHKLLAVIGWSYLFSLGRHTCICICFLSTIRCVSFFSNKWILSIFCERQISIRLFSVSTTSMHSQLLDYLFEFLLCHYISLRYEFRVVFPVTISAYKRCSVRRYHQLFVGVFMSLLRYMCLLAHRGVQYILCFVFLSFVYLMLPFSLDCPLLTASSVFSNVYLNNNY